MSRLKELLSKTIYEDIVVIDSRFPRPLPFGFKNTEINLFFKKTNNINSYTMYPMKAGKEAWFNHGYGITKKEFKKNRDGYLKYYPENRGRVKYLDPKCNYKINLAYSYFLAETYTLLPFYEKNKIPFVFVLYPGGAFGLDNKSSDDMLKKIFSSEYFRKVITTKNITKNYLISKKLCKPEDIAEMRGYVQFGEDVQVNKKYYKKDKDTFDICFVAAKYSEKGEDKGYDTFIEVAKMLSKKYEDIKFHVVGGFSEKDIDTTDLKNQIKFYGFRRPDFLQSFYQKMDILLSPNRPGIIYKGSFDGFPLGADASSMGVALFSTDHLGQNEYYQKDEIVIINNNPEDIAVKIIYYYNKVDELYELSEKGMNTTRHYFNTEEQVEKRINLFYKIKNPW